jgi:arabinofuranosyltransferase
MSPTTRRTTLTAVMAGLFVAWAFWYIERTSLSPGPEGRTVFLLWDDAMVSMRYAKNFAEGHGLVWNPGGERVQGYSNPAIVLLMALFHALPLSPETRSLPFQLVNVALLLGTAHLTRDLAKALSNENEHVGALSGIAILLNASLAILAIQGTDVGVTTFLLVAALRSFVRGHQKNARAGLGMYALLGVAVLVRADGVLALFVLTVAGAFLERTKAPIARGGFVGLVTLGGLVAFGLLYYGEALPNTYYLKATGCPRLAMWSSGGAQTLVTIRGMLLPLGIAGVGTLAFHRKNRFVRVLWAMVASITAYNVWVGGDWIWEYTGRFLAPALPVVIVLFEISAWEFAQRIALVKDDAKTEGEPGGEPFVRLTEERRIDAFVFGSLVAATSFSTSFALAEWLNPSEPTMYKATNVENYAVARYLRDHTDEGTSIGLRWAGSTAYFSGRPGVDVLGKADRHIAHLVVERFAPGHSKWDWAYVVNERKPDLVDGDDRGLGEREDFRAAYQSVRTKVPGVPMLFLRRESRAKLHDDGAVFSDLPTPKETPTTR